MYELVRDWRNRMGLPALSEKIKPVDLEEAFHSGNWVESEFINLDLGHQDRERRLVRIATAKAQQPSAPYTECFAGNRPELKACYRFIDCKAEEVNPDTSLSGHRERTIGRMKKYERVLAVQYCSRVFSELPICQTIVIHFLYPLFRHFCSPALRLERRRKGRRECLLPLLCGSFAERTADCLKQKSSGESEFLIAAHRRKRSSAHQ